MSRRPNEKAVTDFVMRTWPDHEPTRSYVLEFWDHFNRRGLARGNFVADLTSGDDSKLFQRLWEMVLALHLVEQGFDIRSNDPGPDFSFEIDGKKVWIEATAPEPIGLSEKWLSQRGANRVPYEKILLRWTNALSVKKEKFLEYRRKGIVQNNAICVIAINGHLLRDGRGVGISQLPWEVEAVFPIGPLAVTISRRTGERSDLYNSERRSVQKSRSADVPTDSFLKQENRHISAVVGCSSCWKPYAWMSIAHNPLADSRFPYKRFGANQEYVYEFGEDEDYIKRI